jgi:hypothetical protein
VVRLDAADSKRVVEWVWDDAQWGFVRIEQAEDGAPPNDQPIKFTAQQIRAFLDELRRQRGAENEKLFTEDESRNLSEPLAKALAKAGPEHDVTFASTGKPGPRINFFRHARLTTGRVFYRDDQLNVIFGIVHGSFQGELSGSGVLVARTPGSRNRIVDDNGFVVPGESLLYASLPRQDWIQVASLPATPATTLAKETPEPVILTAEPAVPTTTQPTPSTTTQPAARRYAPTRTPAQTTTSSGTVAAGVGAGAAATATAPRSTPTPTYRRPTTTSPPRTSTTTTTARSTYSGAARHYQEVEDRLKGLENLRRQGLISEQEYQKKRRELIDKL